MKQITTLFFVLATISFSFAQSSVNMTAKKQKQELKIKSIDRNYETRSAADCEFSSDFSDLSQWVMDYDTGDCADDCGWQIGYQLGCEGFFPIDTIVSDNGFYALLDSDNYGGEEGGTEVEDAWLTTAYPVDLSNISNVVVQFDTYYQSFNSEKCFLVVSTDGTFPTDLNPDTDASTIPGVYEIFPSLSGDPQASTTNPETVSINISEDAGNQSQVWVRFNWTGTWGYAWFIDNVCITEQHANDIELAYGVVSHNGTNEQYVRVPFVQTNGQIDFSAAVLNSGTSPQQDVEVSLNITDEQMSPVLSTMFGSDNIYALDTDGYVDFTQPSYGPLDPGDSYYFNMSVNVMNLPPNKYTAMFTATSLGDNGGSVFEDNTATREFEITVNEFSVDGIDVYPNPEISRIGTGSFEGGEDGFMMFSYYDVTSSTEVTGARILFDSYVSETYEGFTTPLTVPGGEIIVSLRDTASVFAETFTGVIAETDFIYLDEETVNNGYIDVTWMQGPVSVSPNAYFLAVEMYSNANEADIYIIDDQTVPQPSYMSMIYIPGDQVYTNGDAVAIRMITSDSFNGIPGCTDATACNYLSNATYDDGTCYNNDLGCGCDTPAADAGYDCDGNCLADADGDLVCDEFEVAGCTDSTAFNYNSSATEDDGSCIDNSIGDRYLTEQFNTVSVQYDIEYGNNISVLSLLGGAPPAAQPLLMDIYTPDGDTETNRPVVIMLHTGSFLPAILNGKATGDKSDNAIVEQCTQFAKKGYVAIAINYRQGWNPFSTDENVRRSTYLQAIYRAVQDTRTAVRFLRKSVAEAGNPYGISTCQISVGGMGEGGSISLATATLNDYATELTLPKFIDQTTGYPYIIPDFFGNLDGTTSGVLPELDINGDGTPDATNVTMCTPNHENYSSEIHMAFNIGGALPDSSWINAGEVPIASMQCYLDEDAPYEVDDIIVPTTGEFVVEGHGSLVVQRRSHELGNNDVFNGLSMSVTDSWYGNGDGAVNSGLQVQELNMFGQPAFDNNGNPIYAFEGHPVYEGLFPIVAPKGDVITGQAASPCLFPWNEQGSPWDWWNNDPNDPASYPSISATSPLTNDGGTLTAPFFACYSTLGSPDMSENKGLAFAAMIQEFMCPRIIEGLEVYINCLGGGCTDPLACNYSPIADEDDGTCYYNDLGCGCDTPAAEEGYDCDGNCLADIDSDGVCDEFEIIGCQDQNADNYNSQATEQGTCIYYGCTDILACNYDSNVTDDDNSCIYPALGYNCDGQCLDGYFQVPITAYFYECVEESPGCTDSTALNYDSSANIDNDTCIFPPWEEPGYITICNASLVLTPESNIIVNGQPISEGDWIGIFYNDLDGNLACGGSAIWTGENTLITIWGDDWLTEEIKEGFGYNEALQWKVWDNESNEIFSNVEVDYSTGSQFFDCNGIITVGSINANALDYQEIILPQDWFIFSTYLTPVNTDMESIFQSISDNVIIVKNYTGNVFWPSININSIGSIEDGQAYYVKMLNEDTLKLSGNRIENNLSINIPNDWYYLAYLNDIPESTVDMMAPIVDEIIILKNYSGDVYWPEFNLNGIGDMQPGWGYSIKTNNPVEFIYPDLQIARSIYNESELDNDHHFLNTGNNMTIALPDDIWITSPNSGDELFIKSQKGNIVGYAKYREGGTVITAWGDDQTTTEIDGLKIGEKLHFQLFRNNENTVEKIEILSWKEGSGVYTVNGISVASTLSQNLIKEKKLVKITDVLGRDIIFNNKKATIIYIYDDGSVEKKYLMK